MTSKWDQAASFKAHLLEREKAGTIEISEYETVHHDLKLTRGQTDGYGSATLEEDVNAPGHFHFEILLGPVNSLLLTQFLQALPDEPEDGPDNE